LDEAQAKYQEAVAQRDTARETLANAETNLAYVKALQTGPIPQKELDEAQAKYQEAVAQRDAAQEMLHNAEINLEYVRTLQTGPLRQKELDAAGAESRAAAAQAEATRQKLRALQAGATATQINVARQKVEQARAKVEYWHTQWSYCVVTTPRAGVVVEKTASVGDMAVPKTPLLTLADTARRLIRAGVSDREASRLRPGLPVRARFDALPGQTWDLQIIRVYPAADVQTRLIPVEIGLPGAGCAFRLGLLARLELVLQRVEDTIVIPTEALVVKPGGKTVVFVVEGNRARLKPVQTGLEEKDRVEIVSGLAPGEKLVVQGQELLKDGASVKVKPPPTPPKKGTAAPPPQSSRIREEGGEGGARP
jgi:RND family efflux transporter MFP subunit